MTGTDGTSMKNRIKNLLRSPAINLRRSKAVNKEHLSKKVTLEKVLGITAPGNRALACDPRTGLVAYPAGCVVVLLNPKKNKQHHILNNCRKTITTLSFSPDGKYIVTGESGHMPAVRVWEVTERVQVAELQEHKYGIACVSFSPNSKYIISVGYQHDMMVNVWYWKKNVVVAANKVSSKVTAVSFSDDSSYFVTAGNRHVKFWYLDTKTSKLNATVPLLGRSGLLGELRNNFFSDVACGRGRYASSTFCITSSGLLCEFNDRRLLDKWVELRTRQATSLCVTEECIFCGCADGIIRAFSPSNLHFICSLPRPHSLGTDISTLTEPGHLFSAHRGAGSEEDGRGYPDTVAVTFDPSSGWLSCVYNDHSVYVWDVREPRRTKKIFSALFHSACVWSLEVYPEGGGGQAAPPPGSFLTCSSDNTIRLWNTDAHSTALCRNIISHDLQKIIYVDNNLSGLLDVECTGNQTEKGTGQEGGGASDTRAGIRTLKISPDGRHLASGDRMGILRIHDVESMEEILNVQAHDSEILCLEYTKPETGVSLLATASRDRLIHVLDADRDYSLVQTMDEHSSSITAVRFAANEGKLRLISCGADKSIYFRTAQKTEEGLEFRRTQHVVRKTTLYDMDVDATRKYAAIGCQDRSLRLFNVSTGKQKKLYKGSLGEDGTLIKVQTDPSGLYVATSCSDKNISIFDFYTGECVATMYGHSEVVTGMKFTNDCKHLLTVSGDSCIFIWRLSPELTINMRQRLSELKHKTPPHKPQVSSPPIVTMSSDSDKEVEEEEEGEELISPFMVSGGSVGEETDTSDEQHNNLISHCRNDRKEVSRTPRRRWSRRTDSEGSDGSLMVKSMLDLRQLESYCQHTPTPLEPPHTPVKDHPSEVRNTACSPRRRSPVEGVGLHRTRPELGSTVSLQIPPAWTEEEEDRISPRPDYILLTPNPDPILYPDNWDDQTSLAGSEYQVQESRGGSGGVKDKHSPDSTCSLGYGSVSHLSSPDRPTGEEENSSELDEDDDVEVMKTEVPQTPDQEVFLKKHFVTLNDVNTSGQNSSESVSISSRFLSQGTNRSVFPFSSRGGGGGGGGGGEMKVRPLVSEVRPLMDQNQDQERTAPQCVREETWSSSHIQDQCQNQTGTQEKTQSWTEDQLQDPVLQQQGPGTQNHQGPNLDQDSSHDSLPQKNPQEKSNQSDQTHQVQDQTQTRVQQQGPSSFQAYFQDQTQSSTHQDQVQLDPGENHTKVSKDCSVSSKQQQQHEMLAGSPGPEKVSTPTSSSSSAPPLAQRLTPTRRKTQTAVLGPVVRTGTSSGLRKAQSVHSLLSEMDASQSVCRPSKDASPLPLPLPQRPTTLPSTPRRALSPSSLPPASYSPLHSPNPSSSSSSGNHGNSTPRKRSSYMSPTTSSMAKMCRSVSIGDGLNEHSPSEDSGSSSESQAAVAAAAAAVTLSTPARVGGAPPTASPAHLCGNKPGGGGAITPVAVVPSNASLATPPHAAIVLPLISSSSSSAGNHGNPAATPSKGLLQSKLISKPLPDKPSLTLCPSFSKTSSPPPSPSSPPPSPSSPRSSPSSSHPPQVSAPQLQDSREAPAQSSVPEHIGPTAELREQAQTEAPLTQELQGQCVSVELCRSVVSELQTCVQKAADVYRKVTSGPAANSSPEQMEMSKLLSDAFLAVRAELNALPALTGLAAIATTAGRSGSPPSPPCIVGSGIGGEEPGVAGGGGGGGGGGGEEEEGTLALLERYSVLLVQAVEKRLEHKYS